MTEKIYLTHEQCYVQLNEVLVTINEHIDTPYAALKIFPVPRGGVPVAYMIKNHFSIAEIVSSAQDADIIIDDLIDSGATMERYAEQWPEKPFLALIDKRKQYVGEWIVFPWEQGETDTSADDIPIRLLQYIGEDPNRGGLLETPKRMLKAWDFWTSGYGQKPEDILKVFEDGAEDYDEMVLVKDIPIYSHCEHHLAPFFGVAHIGYIPNGKIVGLSKLSRIADVFARRLQVQERLTNQIAQALEEHLQPLGVAVVIECRHMCMESRGIQRQGATTVTSSMRGILREDAKARAEFMGLLK